jgi:hypothetical protein
MGADLLWTFVRHFQPFHQREMTMRMYPGPIVLIIHSLQS